MTIRSSLLASVLFAAACNSATSERPATTQANADKPTATARASTLDAVPLIPREVLFGNPARTAPQLSPDGTRLAYLAPEEGVLNIWVRTVGKEDDAAVTHDRGRGIRQYFWAQSGKELIYLQDKGGDENWRVYSVALAGGLPGPSEAKAGAPRDLTPLEGVQAQIVAVEPSRPDQILVAINDRDPRYHDVYEIDLGTGKRTLSAKNDINAIAWFADHELRVRAGQVLQPDGGTALMHRPTGQGPFSRLTAWGAEDTFTTNALGFAGDNRTLYLLTSVGSNTSELRSLDVTTRRETRLASDPKADVVEVLTHPTTHEALAVRFVRERSDWKVLDESVAKDFLALRDVNDGDLDVIGADRANRNWLVSYDQDDGPVRFFTWSRDERQARFLFAHRPALENLPLAEMRPVSYKARDGLTINAYLTMPRGVPARNLPAVIHPHGGPWDRDIWGFDSIAQWLANRGYVVLQPNFRGSAGYGKDFLNAGDREWGGKMQDDITDGTRWLIERGIVDAKRVCILGGSYGGYATLMGLVREPDLYACGVDIVGVANLVTWMNTIPPYWKPYEHVLHQRVGNPATELNFLQSRSPVFHAGKIKAPLLIAQGANDPRVPRAESIQIRDALKASGKEVEYVEFPDEGHGFVRPENRLKFFAMAEKFLAAKIGGRAEP
jgi:dipeptidyl aminopeptidase/acylaminoacyl peptidase